MIFTPEVAADLFPFLRGKWGKLLYKPSLYLSGIYHVNQIHEAVERQGIAPGPDFAKAILDQMELEFLIGNPERLAFPEGPFITISNPTSRRTAAWNTRAPDADAVIWHRRGSRRGSHACPDDRPHGRN